MRSHHISSPVPVVSAKYITYLPNANKLQNLNMYLAKTPGTSKTVGTPATSVPNTSGDSTLPHYHFHIHGGACCDPQLTYTSIEAAVAHAFFDASLPIKAIAALNYTVCQFPAHPTLSNDPIEDNHSHPEREAKHKMQVSDVLHGFALLPSFGSHQHLADEYETLLGIAPGTNRSERPAVSPARCDTDAFSARVQRGQGVANRHTGSDYRRSTCTDDQRERLKSI